MADEHPPGFGDNLLRMIAAQLQLANAMNAAERCSVGVNFRSARQRRLRLTRRCETSGHRR